MKENLVKIFKSGKFYNAFGDDGIIIHYLVGYKYVVYKNSVGFPESSIIKVKNALEKEKISYEVYDKDKRLEKYEGISKNYKSVLKRSLEKLEMENRINRLQDRIDNIDLEDLEKIVEGLEDATI